MPSPDGKLWNDINFLYPDYQHGGVGLNMSAKDLVTFDAALFQGRVLDRKTLQLMWMPFLLNKRPGRRVRRRMGYCRRQRHRMVFHIGAGMVEYAHLLDPDLTVVLFTNNQGFNPYRMTIEVMRFFAPEVEKRNN